MKDSINFASMTPNTIGLLCREIADTLHFFDKVALAYIHTDLTVPARWLFLNINDLEELINMTINEISD